MKLTRMVTMFDRALSGLDRVVGWLVMLCMATITFVITLQVVLRYGFNSSLDWGWAVPRLAFICGVFLGMPLALKEGAHVGIDLLAISLPPRGREMLRIFQTVVSALLMICVIVFSTRLAVTLWDQTIPTLPVSVGVFYAVLAFSAGHCLMHLARNGLGRSAAVDDGWETR